MKSTKKHHIVFIVTLGVLVHSFPFLVLAQCPIESPPTTSPPSSIVQVKILSIKPNSDMEGDDDYVPFYDNHADIFGQVTIDSESFSLPEVEDSDFPHWDIVFEKQVATSPVKIVIEVWENDWGLTGSNDKVDINPLPNESALTLDFDLCAMTIIAAGQSHPAQGIIELHAGNESDDAVIRLKVGTTDGRPMTKNDLALVELDMVQVLFKTPKLIAQKPTIVMAAVANNYDFKVNTNVRIIVSGAGVNRNDAFPITLEAGEVKKEYYYLDNPIRFPYGSAPGQVAVQVRVDDVNNQTLDPKDCKRVNDGNPQRITWKTVQTPIRYDLLWTKVGTLLDGFNFTSDELLEQNMMLGGAYIHGVYPLAYPYQHKAPVDIMPPLTAATDFLGTILSPFGIPLDNVIPYALVLELNGVANIVGCDRLMGVLPNKDWFKRFSYDWLDEVTGLSLGEFAPRAVIFLPQYSDGTNLGPAITLPAHELGHTFGLSSDPTLKDSWVCDIDWPILGASACGITGGFDEYKSDLHPKGNPSNGLWIKQGNEPAELDSLVNKEMCESFCFMGGSPANAHLNWTSSNRKWIDAADYDHLVTKLQLKPDPEIVFISGMISWDDQIYISSIQHIGEGIPDRDTSYGAYIIRFVDENGKTLDQTGLPVNWNSPDMHSHPRPITFFSLNFFYPQGTRRIEILNRMSAKILTTIRVSQNKPVIKLRSPVTSKDKVSQQISWKASDRDGDDLQYFILIRNLKEEEWAPLAIWQKDKSVSVSSGQLPEGNYELKAMASDGVHVSASNIISLNISSSNRSVN